MTMSAISRALYAAFWTALLFAFVMAVLPQPPKLPGAPTDKVLHIVAFLTLSALAATAYPRVGLVRIAVWLSAFGALIEIVQAVPALHRDADVVDWLVDTAAVAVALGVVWLFRRKRAGLRGDRAK